MGYASGGEIFDRVADKLVELKAPEELTIEVCAVLTEALRDMDWDTVDESVDRFLAHSAVIAGIRKGAPEWFGNDDEWDGDTDA